MTFEVLGLIAYTQKPSLNVHAEVSRGARSLTFNLSHHLHPYFAFMGSEGSGESALLRRLV